MENNALNKAINKSNQRLLRESLLAENYFSDQKPEPVNNDPRLKSPDDLLNRLVAAKAKPIEAPKPQRELALQAESKPQLELTSQVEFMTASKLKQPQAELRQPTELRLQTELRPQNGLKAHDELDLLKGRYENELAQWKEYDVQVKEWKKRVLLSVQNLKRETEEKEALIKKLFLDLQKKDQEIESYRSSGETPPNQGLLGKYFH